MADAERLTCYRLKMVPGEVEELRTLARLECLRQGRDVTWCELVRDAVKWMTQNRKPVN